VNKEQITGIILAGGQNLRMGTNKAFISWNGRLLIDWVHEALKPICSELIVSANEGDFSHLDVRVIPDRFKKIGPVGGIESSLSASNTKYNIIVSCDTPLLSTEFFQYMLKQHQQYEISIPIHEGIIEPMIGVYNTSVLDKFQEAIANNQYKPPQIIKSCDYQEVGITENLNFYQPDLFLNLNKPEDLKPEKYG